MCKGDVSCKACSISGTRKSKKMAKKEKFNSKNLINIATKGLLTGVGFLAANQVAGKLLPQSAVAQVGGKFAAGAATAFLLGQPLIGLGMITDGFVSGAKSAGIITGTPRYRKLPAKAKTTNIVNGTKKSVEQSNVFENFDVKS